MSHARSIDPILLIGSLIPGGFTFDVSLHSTTVGQREGVFNLIGGFPEITDVEFRAHPSLFRAIYPEHDLRVRQRDPAAFVAHLSSLFPEEKAGIAGLFHDMAGLAADIGRLQNARGPVDMSRFPVDFPHLAKFHQSTWGQMMDTRVKDPRLKAVLSSQWGYYGLPPSKLSCFYYAMPFLGYLSGRGFYPKGRSQDISNAFARFIENRGGRILLNARTVKIPTRDGAASGVTTADGRTFTARVVVSNASPFATLGQMVDDRALVADYLAQCRRYRTLFPKLPFSTPMKKRSSRETFLIARPAPDLKRLAEGGQVLSTRVHRQTPIRVHPLGVTISCIR